MLGGIRDVWKDVTGVKDPGNGQADTSKYAQCSLGERPFDAQASLAFAEVPGMPKLTYGDMMSTSDQSEKMERSGAARRGKSVDFLYNIAEREHGAPKSRKLWSGSTTALEAPKGDYLSLAKTSRAQIQQLIVHRPAVAGKIIVPSFHILDREVSFYVTAQFSPELYVMHELFEQSLRFPRQDSDVQDVLNLCVAFLTLRNIMVSAANAMRGSQS
ncbi:hypothetical protein HDU86_000237 [Geranomyces michiganensis]|nr:hypothetical protein HDU86_000237 [Geranomyces michiganensis]